MSTSGAYPVDTDRGPRLAATYIVGCAVSFVFVVMRLCARYSIAGVSIDDWAMLICWIVFVPCSVIVSIFSLSGGTRHLIYIAQSPTQLQYILKLNWIAQPLAIFCLGASKIAVAFLIIRLLHRTSVWRRWSLYLASGLTGINTVLMIIFTFVQCENPAALWDEDVKATTKCWDPSVQSSFSTYGASLHAAMDFYLALLPVSLVWGLQTDLRKRVALCALLGCGSLTGVCAVVKATTLSTLSKRPDLTWETYPLFMWTGIEIILSIVCGSIPALKPIYAICMGRRKGSSARYNAHGTHKLSSRGYDGSRPRNMDDDNLVLTNVSATRTTVVGGKAALEYPGRDSEGREYGAWEDGHRDTREGREMVGVGKVRVTSEFDFR